MRILALDVGTSSVKAAILEAPTAALSGPIARATYEPDHSTPEAAEVPAKRLWNSLASAAREATRGIDGVEAVGMACLTPALVLLAAADMPISPIWTHLDRRARSAARQVFADVGEEFLATTGNRPLPGGITALCWRRQLGDDSSLVLRVRHYMHANGWLALHMTGQRAFDRANACFSGLYGTLTDQ